MKLHRIYLAHSCQRFHVSPNIRQVLFAGNSEQRHKDFKMEDDEKHSCRFTQMKLQKQTVFDLISPLKEALRRLCVSVFLFVVVSVVHSLCGRDAAGLIPVFSTRLCFGTAHAFDLKLFREMQILLRSDSLKYFKRVVLTSFQRWNYKNTTYCYNSLQCQIFIYCHFQGHRASGVVAC